MAWIRTIAPGDADRTLKRLYDAALRRSGRVFNVISIQGLLPEVLATSTRLYLAVMYGHGPLSRTQREMIATTVSRVNACSY